MNAGLKPGQEFERFRRVGIVAVASIPDASLAIPLAEALLRGGLDVLEITFRTTAAASAIELVRNRFPEVYLGAGTVLSAAQADLAIAAGVDFLVAPGTNHAVVDRVVDRGKVMLPGICTPTELEAVMVKGIRLVKFFPAEPFGGVATIKALAGPYPDARFVPTGGITPSNLPAYLAVGQVVACGGSWIVRADLLRAGDWSTITRLASEAQAIAAATRSGGRAA